MIARLFRNKVFWLVIITTFCLAAFSVTSKSRDKLTFYENATSYIYVPIQKGLSYVSYNIQGLLTYFNDAKSLSAENKVLKDRIARLEEENRKLQGLEEENKRLQEILGIKGSFEEYDMVTSRIIAKEAGNWFNIFTIDKGTKDGITANMTVMTPRGLVGYTISSTPNSSKVMAVIDSESYVSARLSKSRDLVGVRGDLALKESGLVRMVYIPAGVEVSPGDTIETSGMGGVFPAGILIGKVKSMDNDKPQLMRSAVVQPNVDFKRLEEVVVLKRK